LWLCAFVAERYDAHDRWWWDDACVIGVDRDPAMLEKAQHRLSAAWWHDVMRYYRWSYADLSALASLAPHGRIDAVLLDIGVNMEHYKDGERWFSLAMHAPLDMRFCRNEWVPAHEWLMKATYDELMHMLVKWTDFGDRLREKLVESLVHERKRKQFLYTSDLVAWGAQFGLHGKRLGVLFQAMRIEVNGELDQLIAFLDHFPHFLAPGGRVIVISYHSGEDRLVKQAFKDRTDRGLWYSCTKHVITPERKEVQANKAARSAKMRVFELLPSDVHDE
jgi:16S rRNA (cytosine1402-N4)-methyltransferase